MESARVSPKSVSPGQRKSGEREFAAAGNLFPMLNWLDPLTYHTADDDKFPSELPSELKVSERVQSKRSPELNQVAIKLSEEGIHGLWMQYASEYKEREGTLKGLALMAVLNSLIGVDGLIVGARKQVYRQPRPYEVDPNIQRVGHKPGGSSHPSGHAAAAYTAATVLAHFSPERASEFYAVAANVARARVYMGVHFAGDVAAGACQGVHVARMLLGSEPQLTATKDVFES